MTEREVMEYDVVIVGAGPAGLACAIRLKQLKPDTNICVLEKASAVGAHSLSGAVLEPGPLEKLLPDWRSEYTGMKVPAAEDDVRLMTKTGSFKLPDWAVNLSPMHNHGNFIVSLGQLTPWLAQQPKRSASISSRASPPPKALFDEQGAVKGVRIGDMGLDKDGKPGPELHAGRRDPRRHDDARRRLARLDHQAAHREVQPARGRRSADVRPRLQGAVAAAAGPRASRAASSTRSAGRSTPRTYGGSFLYHLDSDRVYVGYVVGLNYEDPRFKPFEAFQQFKHHPRIKPLLEGGEILAAGARTIAAGG